MRREYVGGAPKARLTVLLGASSTNLTITCDDLTNWPTGVSGNPFYVVIDRNTSSEEKILCASRAGNVITVYDDGVLNGRGSDDTSITSHAVNSVIEHVFTATDADEANAHVNDNTTDVHDQYILKTEFTAKGDLISASAAGTLGVVPVGSDGSLLVANATEAEGLTWQSVGADGEVLTADSSAPNGVSWQPTQATPSLIDPFLLMGA